MVHTQTPFDETSNAVFPSVEALAAEIGLSRTLTYIGLRDGSIPSIRIGKRFVISRVAIEKWLASAGGSLHAE